MFALAKMHSRCDSPLARAPVPASSAKGTCSRCISARRKRRGATQRAPPHLADTAEAPGPPCALPSRSSSLTRRRAQRPGVSPRAPTAHAHRAPRSSAAAPQHLRRPPSTVAVAVMLQDTAGRSRPTTPSPLTRPMTTRWATSARRSATSSRGSCPRRRSPPCAHAGRRGGHLWRRSPLEDPPLEPPCGTPAGAPPPLEAPNTGSRHPGPTQATRQPRSDWHSLGL